MITLATADTIAGIASAASQVTCTIFGMELNGTTEVYKVLYQGQLAASAATIYTAPTSNTAFIRSISVVNNDSSPRTFQLYRGGTAASNVISPLISLAANGGSATYEDGYGWSSSGILPGSTLLNDVHSGYSDYQSIATPATPGAGVSRLWGALTSGRMMVRWMGPSGLNSPLQPALFGNNIIMYYPTSSTNGGTATLGGIGISWTAGGTVSHPTPAAGIVSQIHRTRYANVVTTTNQTLGIMATAAGLPQFYRGNSAGLGGFFFMARYTIELWPANTCRIFVGLSDSATAQVTLDIASMTGNLCAFAHDTADGANIMWFITRDNSTTHKTSLAGFNITAGQGYDFYMFCKPNDSTIYYRVDDINAGTTIIDTSETNNLPTNSAMMGPQVHMSNGTANITATTVAPGINRVYVESDH